MHHKQVSQKDHFVSKLCLFRLGSIFSLREGVGLQALEVSEVVGCKKCEDTSVCNTAPARGEFPRLRDHGQAWPDACGTQSRLTAAQENAEDDDGASSVASSVRQVDKTKGLLL